MTSRRKPQWIRGRLPSASAVSQMNRQTLARSLHTVCLHARCPNRGECAQKGNATFLILGDLCTRNCAFCAVAHGHPGALDPDEPKRVAEAVKSLNVVHAVITSVTRDDLPDGGASVFAATIAAVRGLVPHATVEVLVPDFRGCGRALETVVHAAPEVIGHNLETVPRLYGILRGGADYAVSLALLRNAKRLDPRIITKSGIMLGIGETREELRRVIGDLARIRCDVLTLGQYLQPTPDHHPVVRYLGLEEFHDLREIATREGIPQVVAGPMVRSSYHARDVLDELLSKAGRDGLR
ncbi:MAG: lipoyl synthase [Thermodesulfobacteriota bacterium]